MTSFRNQVTCIGLLMILAPALAPGDESVVNSKHDLSSRGPGPIRAVQESRICIFCHTPHNARYGSCSRR